jgi:alkaline phosphatase D
MILLLALLQSTGVKVGEVGETSALLWFRADGPGRMRVNSGEWVEAVADRDFTHVFKLDGLKPSTLVEYAAEVEGKPPLKGSFRTAPKRDVAEDVVFTVITGQAYKDLDDPAGFRIYPAMAKLEPRFIVPTGDTVYYDNDPPLATTKALARFHWKRMYELPRHVDFHLKVPGYWEKDDHDLIWNDCWPSMKVDPRLDWTFKDGLAIFREQVPMGTSTYRSARWGKRLEVWMVEGRDFRSANTAPDGPEKTIWGAEQKAWLKKSLLESDAEWKVLVSPTPIVGPDRGNKGDNHANKQFAHEGNEIRRWFGGTLPKNFFIACGDRHWQYHSVDPETSVQEFSCGPASDKHAGGSPGLDERLHRFHRVKGGFLSVSATAAGLAFRLHDVDGAVVYEKTYP